MTTAELKKDSKVNKELKAEFLTKLFDNYKCSDKWKAYYTKDIEDVCRINDKDEYFYIDKPYIKKSFCFGYGMYLQSTEEESDRASDMAVKAQTDVTYFINENLQEINEKITLVKYHLIPAEDWQAREEFFKNADKQGLMRYGQQMCEPYITAPFISTHGDFQVSLSYFNKDRDMLYLNEKWVLRKATTEELEKILVFYEKAKARLIKRLNTYLKKYGLEKLHVWTYLVD